MRSRIIMDGLLLMIAFTFVTCSNGRNNNTDPVYAKAITVYSFVSPAATGIIDESAKTISVTVPDGTSVTAIIATFQTTGTNVKVGSIVQLSGTTPTDFTNPVQYTVTAADGSTAIYTVTVAIVSSAKAITVYSFVSPAATGIINESAKSISVTVPYGTNVTAIIATFQTTGTSVKVGSTVQISGTTPNDFTNPVQYTVTAADSSALTYTVTVNSLPGSYQPIAINPASIAVMTAAETGLPKIGNPWVSSDEPGLAELGTPYQICVWESNQTINVIDEWYFPIMVNGTYRYIVTVAKINDQWQAVSMGQAGFATSLQATETSHPLLNFANRGIIKVYGFSSYPYEILGINLSETQPSFLMLPPATDLGVLSYEELTSIIGYGAF